MTDDVPTSDGTRHTEEAVNIPQVTDPRTSSLEDIAQVLSAKTPDIADDPHPEKADSNGAGPAEGSAAEAASADADTDDADTETDTESDAESDAGDGPEPSAEEKAESEAESDQDDAPVEEAEAEAPQEGDAIVGSGDSKDELSEGESVTDEDAQPEADGAESDSDTDPESEAAEGASESVDDAGEGEPAEPDAPESSEKESEASEEESQAGPAAISQALIVSFVTFGSIYFAATRLFGLDRRFGATLAAGGSICGVSGAIAIGGACRARPQHVSVAISLVIVWAVAMIFLLPSAARVLGLEPGIAGAWIGTSEFADAAGFAAAEAIGHESAVQAFTLMKVGGRDMFVGGRASLGIHSSACTTSGCGFCQSMPTNSSVPSPTCISRASKC